MGLAAVSLALLWTAACASGPPAPDPLELTYDPSLGVDLEIMERRSSGLLLHDMTEGTGTQAFRDSEVQIHYIGALPDGTVFDSSVARGEPLRVQLDGGDVIRGWEEGIPGMREGGQRTLVVPARLGYGSRGLGELVPPGQVLVFQIQLLDVR